MKEEIWKDIDGYNGLYQISNKGNVRRVSNQGTRSLKSSPDTNGYLQVKLSLNGCPSQKSIHKLVAVAFIPNDKERTVVRHINGKREDNNVENLEWATKPDINPEKMKEAKEHKLIGRRESDGHIEVFNSVKDVCTKFDITSYQMKKILEENERLLKPETTIIEMLQKDSGKIINPDIPVIDSSGNEWIFVHCKACYDKYGNLIWTKPQSSRGQKIETLPKKDSEQIAVDINEKITAVLPKVNARPLPQPYESIED